MPKVLEIVEMRPKTGVKEVEFVRTAKSMTTILEGMTGYISRDLAKSEDGAYVDVVQWESMECARNAAEKVMSDASCGPFFEMIDESSLKMNHYRFA